MKKGFGRNEKASLFRTKEERYGERETEKCVNGVLNLISILPFKSVKMFQKYKKKYI